MKRIWIGLLLLSFGVPASMARQTDVLQKDGSKVEKQISLIHFDKIEQTESEKYVIVYKDNLCGIYDVKSMCNVTDVKYTALKIRDRKMDDDVGAITVFVYKCGEQQGLISLCEANNEYVSIEL